MLLKNIIDPSELIIDDEYYDFKEDVREEAAKYGDLRSMEVPRPRDDSDRSLCVGRVFLEYSYVEDAISARSV